MSGAITITIDGVEVQAQRGQTIMTAADAADIYIPRLCAHRELSPFGACRVCTVMVDGLPKAACTEPVSDGAVVENETPESQTQEQQLVKCTF